jgi:hypothetical protein
MYLSALQSQVSTANLTPTGEYKGTSCPSGQAVISSFSRPVNTQRGIFYDKYVKCGIPPAAPPPPPPQTTITVSPTISPGITSQFTPQFAPAIQAGSGTQVASQGQVAPTTAGTTTSGTQSGGDVSELIAYMREQEAAAAQRRQEEAAAKARSEAARLAEDEAARVQQYEAMLQQQENQRTAQETQAEAAGAVPAFGATVEQSLATTDAPTVEQKVIPAWMYIAGAGVVVGIAVYAKRRKKRM